MRLVGRLMLKTILLRLREYVLNPDPMAKAAGTVAVLVAGNQPFYPPYLHAIAGTAAWPAWFTLLSTPLFVAVPAVARRYSVAGRALLPVALNAIAAKYFTLNARLLLPVGNE